MIAGADAHLMGAMDQFLRSQPPVRGGGMAVQIVNHCVLAVAQRTLLDINVNKHIIIPTGRENLQTRVDFIPLN